jgi:hypothetical protein
MSARKKLPTTPIFRTLLVSVMAGGNNRKTVMNKSGGRHGQICTGRRRFFSILSSMYVTHLRLAI